MLKVLTFEYLTDFIILLLAGVLEFEECTSLGGADRGGFGSTGIS